MLSIFSRCGNSGNAGSSSEGDEKVLKVGMECAYAPFNWTQTDDSNGAVKIAGIQEYAYGYDVMMAKKIAEKLGCKLEINKMEWVGFCPGVSSGKIYTCTGTDWDFCRMYHWISCWYCKNN